MSRIKSLISAFPGRRYADGGQVEPEGLGSDPSMQGSGPDASGIVPTDYDPMDPAGDPSYSANAAKERKRAGYLADKYVVAPFTAAHDVMDGTRDPYEAADSMQGLINLGAAPSMMLNPGVGMMGGRGSGAPRPPRELDPHGFYSKALEESKGLQINKGTVQQFTNQLQKAGVKKTELEATGWTKLDPNTQMTRADVEQHFRDNRVAFDIAMKGQPTLDRTAWVNAWREHNAAYEEEVAAGDRWNTLRYRDPDDPRIADAYQEYRDARDRSREALNTFQDAERDLDHQRMMSGYGSPHYSSYTTRTKTDQGKPVGGGEDWRSNSGRGYTESVFHYPPKETLLDLPADEVHANAVREIRRQLQDNEIDQHEYDLMVRPDGTIDPDYAGSELRNVLYEMGAGDAATGRRVPEPVTVGNRQYYRFPREEDVVYRSSHWDEPNTFLHTRQTDRAIPGFGKSHYIEEIQSDWGQQGRDKGFVGEGVDPMIEEKAARSAYSEAYTDWMRTVHEGPSEAERTAREAMQAAERRYTAAMDATTAAMNGNSKDYSVPKAPLLETGDYTELGLKKAFIDAARKDMDSVTVAPASEHTRRYVYPAIGSYPEEKLQKMERGYNSYYGDRVPKAMKKVATMVDPKAQVEDYEFNAGPASHRDDRDIMRGDEADRILSMTAEYGEMTRPLNFVKGHGVKLTPEMKEKIKTDGLPLFLRGLPIPPPMALDPEQDPYARAEFARGGSVDKDDSPDYRQRWKERREGTGSVIDSSTGPAYPYITREDGTEMPTMDDLTRQPRHFDAGGYATGSYGDSGASNVSFGGGSIPSGGFLSGSGSMGSLGNSATFGGSGGALPGSNSNGFSNAGIGGGGGFTSPNGGFGPSNTVGNSSTFGGSGSAIGGGSGQTGGGGGPGSGSWAGNFGSGAVNGINSPVSNGNVFGGFGTSNLPGAPKAAVKAPSSGAGSSSNGGGTFAPATTPAPFSGTGLVGASEPQQTATVQQAPPPAAVSGFSWSPPGGLIDVAAAGTMLAPPSMTKMGVGATGDNNPAAYDVASDVNFGPSQVSTTTETNPVGLRSEISMAEDAYNAAARKHGLLDSVDNEFQNPYSTVHKMVQTESGWDPNPSLKLRGQYGAPTPEDYVNGTLTTQLDKRKDRPAPVLTRGQADIDTALKLGGFTNPWGYSGLSQVGKAFNKDNNDMAGEPGAWSVEQQAETAMNGMEKNAKALAAELGRPITGADLYAAHNLGLAGYLGALNNPDSPLTKDMLNNPAFARNAANRGEYARAIANSFGSDSEMATDFTQRDIAPMAPADRPPGLIPGGYFNQITAPFKNSALDENSDAADMVRAMGFGAGGADYFDKAMAYSEPELTGSLIQKASLQDQLAQEGIAPRKVPTLSINPNATPDVTQMPSFVREFLAGPDQYENHTLKPGVAVTDMNNPLAIAGSVNSTLPSFVTQALAGAPNSYGVPNNFGGSDTGRGLDVGRGDRPYGTSTQVATRDAVGNDLTGPSTREYARIGDTGKLEGASDIDQKILSTMPTIANVVVPILAGPFAPLIMAANMGSYALTGKSLFTHMAENPGDITALGLDGSGKLNSGTQNLFQQLAQAAPPRSQPTQPSTTTDVPEGETLTLPPAPTRKYIPLTDYENYGQGPAHDFYQET